MNTAVEISLRTLSGFIACTCKASECTPHHGRMRARRMATGGTCDDWHDLAEQPVVSGCSEGSPVHNSSSWPGTSRALPIGENRRRSACARSRRGRCERTPTLHAAHAQPRRQERRRYSVASVTARSNHDRTSGLRETCRAQGTAQRRQRREAMTQCSTRNMQ
jgi:hypothetical protein